VIACVIPAFEAEGTVGAVVAGVRAALGDIRVIVVDDGSTDGTRAAARMAADRVVGFDRNRGKGAALRAGFEAALADGATAVLTVDADGQHEPGCAAALIDALAGADVVVGVRRRVGTAMPWHRRVTNTLSSAAVSVCAGRPMADVQSGYRAVRAAVLRSIAPVGDRYEYETDFLIAAARAGFAIAWVPVPTVYGAASHFRGVRDTARVVGAICRRLPTSILQPRR
jgi:glycosyltransferase involved in cell wall biosynthesis